ncbi:Serine/threonine-protein phosphatase 1 [Roseovarius albus]|uniref:Serine/threonine-protein phosphatase 1 n=1 Tax=Roseovarius albus TaxID=1247867 RepID=A0A1X6YVA1_9RHOB|nr:metallophosphoesterase [Roseovarius albus]SLN32431.1 Serine/threonine-protein phosphatase 1 [Roseovarius albus]
MTLWTRLYDKLTGREATFQSVLAPDSPFVAIGDIHGRLDLLEPLLAKIQQNAPDLPLIFLGDYVDRGPDSAGVLARLKSLEETSKQQVVSLLGNHDVMMLSFLDTPEQEGPRWLRYGGEQTLESFGLSTANQSMTTLRDQLLENIDPALLEWLRARPVVWQSGNVIASHAGGNPNRPIEPHRGHSLLWGHADIHTTPRTDGLWMVHGHFAGDEAYVKDGRICIDTRAHSSGVLTAAIISQEGIEFLST